jgi:hypothetical protein
VAPSAVKLWPGGSRDLFELHGQEFFEHLVYRPLASYERLNAGCLQRGIRIGAKSPTDDSLYALIGDELNRLGTSSSLCSSCWIGESLLRPAICVDSNEISTATKPRAKLPLDVSI